jgi:hypothetical protein
MLVKTLILGLISAGAAGAVVYYGTAPNAPVKSEPAAITAESGNISALKSEKISPPAPTVKKGYVTGETAVREANPKMALEESTQETKMAETKTAMDSQSEAEILGTPAPLNQAQSIEAKPEKKPQTRWLDQYLKKNASENSALESTPAPSAEAAEGDMPKDKLEDVVPPAVMSEAANISELTQDTGAEDGPRYFKIEDGKLVEVSPDEAKKISSADKGGENEDYAQDFTEDTLPDDQNMEDQDKGDNDRGEALPEATEYEFTSDISNMADDSTPMIATVMKEAALIKKPELRDQAYFEITEFALSEGRFESARIAHDMIAQDELAYAAKSRIAVAYAQGGQASKAFKTISEVEEAELRDFMRLQVIEALIAPENLPQGWQEKR